MPSPPISTPITRQLNQPVIKDLIQIRMDIKHKDVTLPWTDLGGNYAVYMGNL